MKVDSALFAKLQTYPHAIVSWVADDGYPMQTPALFEIDASRSEVLVQPTGVPLPVDREINFTVSHIRPQPGTGYDQRRYIELWGRIAPRDGGWALSPGRAWGWDEREMPFFEYSERSNQQARRYLQELSAEQGRQVKPRLSRFWTFLLATRLPFLTATIVPVLLGIAIAAKNDHFNWWLALLTLIGAAAIHIGLNVANDVFDAMSGADEANVNPTQFSGGSRVIQRGLVTLRQMGVLCIGAYAVGIAIGLFLVVYRSSVPLLIVGVIGVLLSVFYTAPPLKLVHRGLGEITTALGFGPIMVLGGVPGADEGVVSGAVRRIDPRGDPDRPHTLCKRDPGPQQRRARRQAHAAGALERRRGHEGVPRLGALRLRRHRRLGDPGRAAAADASSRCLRCRSCSRSIVDFASGTRRRTT